METEERWLAMVIDFEHHLFMADQVLKGPSQSGNIIEHFWDSDGIVGTRKYEDTARVEKHLQFMDEAGIDVAVLTTNFISGLDQMKRWNDYCAGVVKEHPDRFVGFACIPPLGGKVAFQELERAIMELGLRGVHIWSRIEGYHLDARELWPFYEQVSRLNVPIDVHVTMKPSGFDALNAPYALYFTVARELDICATTLRICLGGVLEEFPDLAFIINHFGGGISAIMERVDTYMSYIGPSWPSFYFGKPLINKPWREYFDKLYFNIAGCEVGLAALKSALLNISPSKLVFGTDFPFNFEDNTKEVRNYIDGIRNLDLSSNLKEAILSDNAANLLGIQRNNG
jgi:2,3-dihydroxybenzoate decarboxylase